MGEITRAQAEARRRNGSKSMGPVTAEGKARSERERDQARVVRDKACFVADGSLREDPDDAKALYEAVVSSLEPGDDALLNHLAGQVATLLWRELRLGVGSGRLEDHDGRHRLRRRHLGLSGGGTPGGGSDGADHAGRGPERR